MVGARQGQSLLMKGGATVLGAFFDQHLPDRFYFLFAPEFLEGRRASRLPHAQQAHNPEGRRVDPNLLVSGLMVYPL